MTYPPFTLCGMADVLPFSAKLFREAREPITYLCKALAYAATAPDGGPYVQAFLKAKEAQRLLNEAQRAIREFVE